MGLTRITLDPIEIRYHERAYNVRESEQSRLRLTTDLRRELTREGRVLEEPVWLHRNRDGTLAVHIGPSEPVVWPEDETGME